jgi:2-oxoglutarate ferredoxin oxidoreductase subunit beta
MSLEIEQLLRSEKLPHIWCPGCGIGIVTGAMLRVILELGLDPRKTVLVSGIGCSSRAPNYTTLNTVHSIHGRALAVATGIKMAKPAFTVIVFTGDGDGAAIGGNHLIHACRRNIDLTCVLFNNTTYGMTGGQTSPTMKVGDRSTTARHGQVEPAFDLCRLTQAAGASFVARGTAGHIRVLEKLIKSGVEHKGFSFVEAVVPCPTEFGRRNSMGSAVKMLDDERSRSISKSKAEKLPAEELVGKIVTGLLYHDPEAPEYQETHAAAARAQASAMAKAKGLALENPPMGDQK